MSELESKEMEVNWGSLPNLNGIDGTYKTVSLPMMVFVVITIGKIRIRIGFN